MAGKIVLPHIPVFIWSTTIGHGVKKKAEKMGGMRDYKPWPIIARLRYRRDLVCHFERVAALDEDAVERADARAHHDGGRRGEA